MRSFSLIAPAMLVIVAMAAVAAAKADKEAIARGSYLVNRASMCVDCHTPKLPHGKDDPRRLMAGAPIGFKPLIRVPKWNRKAPNLTPVGLPAKWSDAQLVKFLTTGIDTEGHHADPPMPPYRFHQDDAKALTAYLRSLPPVRSHPKK